MQSREEQKLPEKIHEALNRGDVPFAVRLTLGRGRKSARFVPPETILAVRKAAERHPQVRKAVVQKLNQFFVETHDREIRGNRESHRPVRGRRQWVEPRRRDRKLGRDRRLALMTDLSTRHDLYANTDGIVEIPELAPVDKALAFADEGNLDLALKTAESHGILGMPEIRRLVEKSWGIAASTAAQQPTTA